MKTPLTDAALGELLEKFPRVSSPLPIETPSVRISLADFVLYKSTPCAPPEVWEMDGLRYLDQPLYVSRGQITRDDNGHETGKIVWEKHEAILPVI